jgi:hypothetical protein
MPGYAIDGNFQLSKYRASRQMRVVVIRSKRPSPSKEIRASYLARIMS